MSDFQDAPRVGGVVDLGAYRRGKDNTNTEPVAVNTVPGQQDGMSPLHLLMSTAQSVSMLWGLLIEKGLITMADFEQARDNAAQTPGDVQPQTT